MLLRPYNLEIRRNYYEGNSRDNYNSNSSCNIWTLGSLNRLYNMSLIINYITGYAGTGKSYTLQQQLKTLAPDKTIVVAPTHKALVRLDPHTSPHTGGKKY